jgi:hypothetical protein
LNKLKEQQAAFGLHTPPHVLIQIEDLEAEIEDLQSKLESFNNGKNDTFGWQALVIDADNHWREIIATNINLLGGTAIDCQVIPTEEQRDIVDACVVAVVGSVAATEAGPKSDDWIPNMTRLGRRLPIILLTSWQHRDMAISLRHALRNDNNNVTIATIFKENFDAHWFSQIIHQLLPTER